MSSTRDKTAGIRLGLQRKSGGSIGDVTGFSGSIDRVASAAYAVDSTFIEWGDPIGPEMDVAEMVAKLQKYIELNKAREEYASEQATEIESQIEEMATSVLREVESLEDFVDDTLKANQARRDEIAPRWEAAFGQLAQG